MLWALEDLHCSTPFSSGSRRFQTTPGWNPLQLIAARSTRQRVSRSSQLYRAEEAWSTGYAPFYGDVQHGMPDGRQIRLVSAIQVRFGGLDPSMALLDTASTWSVIGPELYKSLGEPVPILQTKLHSRFGQLDASLVSVSVAVPATEGQDLILEAATVLYVEDWTHVPVIGMRGFLERVRFAIDPGGTDGGRIYFASKAEHGHAT